VHTQHLASTPLIDSGHPEVRAFARHHAQGDDDRQRAVSLYLAVRDAIRYDPYQIDLSPDGMRASSVLARGHGWCVTKATLLAAAARAAGIPARLGFAGVRNHLSTERMRQTMQTDVFHWHGFTELWLDGAWRKATPAFNTELCNRFGPLPLDAICADFAQCYRELLAPYELALPTASKPTCAANRRALRPANPVTRLGTPCPQPARPARRPPSC